MISRWVVIKLFFCVEFDCEFTNFNDSYFYYFFFLYCIFITLNANVVFSLL